MTVKNKDFINQEKFTLSYYLYAGVFLPTQHETGMKDAADLVQGESLSQELWMVAAGAFLFLIPLICTIYGFKM